MVEGTRCQETRIPVSPQVRLPPWASAFTSAKRRGRTGRFQDPVQSHIRLYPGWVCMKNQLGCQTSSFLSQAQFSLSCVLFKHHDHIKTKSCLSEDILLTLMKSQIPMAILSVTRYWECLT